MTDDVRSRLTNILKQAQGDRSIRKFAKDLGMSHVTVGEWISGTAFPERESLEKIAATLGLSLDDLLADLRGDRLANHPEKAEDLLPLANNLSDSEAFRLATLLLDRVNRAIAQKLN